MTSQGFSEDQCPKCGSEMVPRPFRPYPAALQAAFGVSFILFLVLADRIRTAPSLRWTIWAWSAAQLILGIQLVRRRMQAKKTVLRCVRCR